MALLTKTAFLSKWAANFLDNVARLITELLMRDFRQDISDSFLSIQDNFHEVASVDVAASPIVLTMGNISGGSVIVHKVFKGNAAIGGAKTWSFANITSHRRAVVNFQISALPAVQTFPSTVIMATNAGSWNTATQEWTPDDTGKYQMEITYDDTDHHVTMKGPFT